MGHIASVLGSQTPPSLTFHGTLWRPVLQPGLCFEVPAWVWSLLLGEALQGQCCRGEQGWDNPGWAIIEHSPLCLSGLLTFSAILIEQSLLINLMPRVIFLIYISFILFIYRNISYHFSYLGIFAYMYTWIIHVKTIKYYFLYLCVFGHVYVFSPLEGIVCAYFFPPSPR